MMSGNIMSHIAERVTSMGKVIIKYENDDIKICVSYLSDDNNTYGCIWKDNKKHRKLQMKYIKGDKA